MLTVEDPTNVATGFATLNIGTSLDRLAAAKVSRTALPLAMTVTSKDPGETTLWVEARDVDDLPLARGSAVAVFARQGTPTAAVRLAKACSSNGECNDGLFCSGTSQCQEGMCAVTNLPCVSDFPCVRTGCVELSGGEGSCTVTPDNSLCPAGNFCSATAGCLPNCGNGTIDEDEACDDGDQRDTGNGCAANCQRNDLCGDGTPQILFEQCDDGDLDDCNGCRTDCRRGCICAGANPCGGSDWCDGGECVACDVATHCGPACTGCSGETPLCAGVTAGCVCDPSPAPRGSCGRGTWCDGGACTPCDDAQHCGQECVACTGNTPSCGGPQAGCVASDCSGQSDFAPCSLVTVPDRWYDICVDETCVSPGCGDATCNPPGPSFARADVTPGWEYPDTGQTGCADDSFRMDCTPFPCNSDGSPTFCGQDAQYGWDTTHAASARYVRAEPLAGEPIVLDTLTGLVWQGCVAGRSGSACDQGATAGLPWAGAVAFCDGFSWAGYRDWRLPDLHELASLASLEAFNPAIDIGEFPGTPPSTFWSASTTAAHPNNAWCIHFFVGGSECFGDLNDPGYVRCVRGGR